MQVSFFFFFFLIYLFLAALGLCCCMQSFSSCGERGLLFVVVRGLLTVVASLSFWRTGSRCTGFSSWGARAQLPHGMWDRSRSGLEPVSPALGGRFSATAPPGKPCVYGFDYILEEKELRAIITFSYSLCLFLQREFSCIVILLETVYTEVGLGTDRMHFKMSSLAANYPHSHTLDSREFEGSLAD